MDGPVAGAASHLRRGADRPLRPGPRRRKHRAARVARTERHGWAVAPRVRSGNGNEEQGVARIDERRAANRRTGLMLAVVAFAFFVVVILKYKVFGR